MVQFVCYFIGIFFFINQIRLIMALVEMEIDKIFFDLFYNFMSFIHLFIDFNFIFNFKMLANNFNIIITFLIFNNFILRSVINNQCHIRNKFSYFLRSLFFKNRLELLKSIILFNFYLRLKTLIDLVNL